MKIRSFLSALLLLGLAASHAAAQTVINSVPYTIQSSGHYIINGNLSFPGGGNTPCIQISAPNVILDLNGYFVASGNYAAGGGGGNNSVIYVGDYANVTIKNGTVAGAPYGIYFGATTAANSRNYVVDSVAVTRCYLGGIFFVSNIGAPGSVVRGCSISVIGNSTYQTETNPSAIYTYGGVRSENNNIGNLTATGGGTSYGINASTGDFSIGNTITNCTVGIVGGKYLNNLTNGCTTAFEGGSNATGNN